ncbi:unnamed protein product, partial [Callosobruchus maculatus]
DAVNTCFILETFRQDIWDQVIFEVLRMYHNVIMSCSKRRMSCHFIRKFISPDSNVAGSPDIDDVSSFLHYRAVKIQNHLYHGVHTIRNYFRKEAHPHTLIDLFLLPTEEKKCKQPKSDFLFGVYSEDYHDKTTEEKQIRKRGFRRGGRTENVHKARDKIEKLPTNLIILNMASNNDYCCVPVCHSVILEPRNFHKLLVLGLVGKALSRINIWLILYLTCLVSKQQFLDVMYS